MVTYKVDQTLIFTPKEVSDDFRFFYCVKSCLYIFLLDAVTFMYLILMRCLNIYLSTVRMDS